MMWIQMVSIWFNFIKNVKEEDAQQNNRLLARILHIFLLNLISYFLSENLIPSLVKVVLIISTLIQFNRFDLDLLIQHKLRIILKLNYEFYFILNELAKKIFSCVLYYSAFVLILIQAHVNDERSVKSLISELESKFVINKSQQLSMDRNLDEEIIDNNTEFVGSIKSNIRHFLNKSYRKLEDHQLQNIANQDSTFEKETEKHNKYFKSNSLIRNNDQESPIKKLVQRRPIEPSRNLPIIKNQKTQSNIELMNQKYLKHKIIDETSLGDTVIDEDYLQKLQRLNKDPCDEDYLTHERNYNTSEIIDLVNNSVEEDEDVIRQSGISLAESNVSYDQKIWEMIYLLQPPEVQEEVADLVNISQEERMRTNVYKDYKYLMENRDSLSSESSMYLKLSHMIFESHATLHQYNQKQQLVLNNSGDFVVTLILKVTQNQLKLKIQNYVFNKKSIKEQHAEFESQNKMLEFTSKFKINL